jgi:hypothetical protein
MLPKKKYSYAIVILLLVAGLVFYISAVPHTYRHEVIIRYGLFKTGEQLNNPINVVKWYIPFETDEAIKKTEQSKNPVTVNDNSLTVTEPTLTSAIIKSGYKNRIKQFLFTAMPIDTSSNSCTLWLVYKSTLLDHWLDKGDLEKNAVRSLANLKDQMEDTRRFYGYPITQTTVTDTSFLFLPAVVPVTEKKAATKALFDKLIAYAKEKNAGYTGTRIFYSSPEGKDLVRLHASIVIRNNIRTAPDEAIQFKRMPFGKNLLVADYTGPFGEVSKVYTAMENYKSDHNLSSMAIPFQKFMTDGYDFADDQMVEMKVYYPIY